MVVLQPCTLGWQYPADKTIEIAKLAVETKFWPLYEVENGKYKLTYKPSKDIPIIDFLKTQGRFKHLLAQRTSQSLTGYRRTLILNGISWLS